eukprot:5900643-Pyramimonas_sp.AAC.1
MLEVLLEPDRQGVIDGETSQLLRADEARPGAAEVYWDKTLRNNRDECSAPAQGLLGRTWPSCAPVAILRWAFLFAGEKSGK